MGSTPTSEHYCVHVTPKSRAGWYDGFECHCLQAWQDLGTAMPHYVWKKIFNIYRTKLYKAKRVAKERACAKNCVGGKKSVADGILTLHVFGCLH